jgi:hypothetical protein
MSGNITRTAIAALAAAFVIVVAVSCSKPAVTSTTQQPDDIVITPGGLAYRANVHEQGIPDQWPTIQTTEIVLGTKPDTARIRYRNNIETRAGQTRNSILTITLPNENALQSGISAKAVSVNLENPPAGFTLASGQEWHGPGGTSEAVVMIATSSEVKAGQYDIRLAFNINDKDYGYLPCVIKVTK